MPTFSENIQRMKAASSANSQFRVNESAEIAHIEGKRAIQQADEVATALSGFSKRLQEWKQNDIKKKEQEGREEFIKAEEEKAAMMDEKSKRLLELEQRKSDGKLSDEFINAEARDIRIEELKKEILDMGGPDAFPDADRLGKLSPHQQVGFVKEKLRLFNESYPDKLAHLMANSEKTLSLGGLEFSMKQINENNLALPMKEYGMRNMSADIKKAAGIHKFSPEMLRLAGVNEAIEKAHTAQMSKHRARYNIESSEQTRGKAKLAWTQSKRTGKDIQAYVLRSGNTVNKDNVILGTGGGWKSFDDMIVAEAVAKSGSTAYIDEIYDQPMPDSMAKAVGAKPGTTFAEHWKNKKATLKARVNEDYGKVLDAELAAKDLKQKEIELTFITESRKRDLSRDEVYGFIDQCHEFGVKVPARIKDYQTASQRDETKDIDNIEDLMATQKGRISHSQLDMFHPRAALKYRDKADKFEKEAFTEGNADKQIKAALDQTFAGMGIKGNEKTYLYEHSSANAKADYLSKYNRYISYGYDSKTAAYWALRGKLGEARDEKGEPIPGEVGVITEILEKERNNKYTQFGFNVQNTLGEAHVRVRQAYNGKIQIHETQGSIVNTEVIGGSYGQNQLNIIKSNIDKYGVNKGLALSTGAVQYYRALATGLNYHKYGGARGLIDAQLKVIGHPGVNTEREDREFIQLVSHANEDGTFITDPQGVFGLTDDAFRALESSVTIGSYFYASNLINDASSLGESIWDNPTMLLPGLRGDE